MSGNERGGRIRRGRQHLPRNSLTPTSCPSAISAPPPLDSTSPAQRQQSATYSCPPARQEPIAPPPFPNLAVTATVIVSILAAGPDDVFGSPAAATTTPIPAPVTQAPEDGNDRPEAKNDESAEEKAASTSKKSQKKKYKSRPGRSRRKPGRKTPGNARATCGHCKRPKNHMMTPSKPPKKEKDEEKGDGSRKITDSDRESLICACDEDEEVRRAHKRNSYVEGETPGSPEDNVGDVVASEGGLGWVG